MTRIHRATLYALFLTTLGISTLARAIPVSGQGTWETTLQGRDLDGNGSVEAYYDTDLNITWLEYANAAGTTLTWSAANAWAAGLTVGTVTGWRLPTTVDVGNNGATYTSIYQGVDSGYNITTHSEMSHLFYLTLGNTAYYDTAGVGPQTGWGLTNTGPFSNVQSNRYWSATEYAPATGIAWYFNFNDGNQSNLSKPNRLYAWAVHSGDVGASVPLPAAAWLFGSGLLGLLGIAGKRRR